MHSSGVRQAPRVLDELTILGPDELAEAARAVRPASDAPG